MIYFALIYNWLHERIDTFGAALLGAVGHWMTALALILVTIWIIIQGYRLITGQSREPMMGLVVNMVRIVVIVSVATTVGAVGTNLHDLVTTELTTSINQLFTGDTTTLAQTIDKNLAGTQLAMAAIDTVQIPQNDAEAVASKARAQAFAIFGTASPPMMAAAMLLLYEMTLALVIGLAPLFIMCLIFEQTKGLFQKWLLYGIGTLFSMGVLAFISSLVLDLTLRVTAALWATDVITAITGTTAEGFTSTSLQQGGMGLLMTFLIVSSPPLAAMFFQGTVGNFLSYSAFNTGGGNGIGPQGQPPGSHGGRLSSGSNSHNPNESGGAENAAHKHAGGTLSHNVASARASSGSNPAALDAVKSQPPTRP